MRIVLLPLILGARAIALIHFAYPAGAAAACPSCYGFSDVGDGIYVGNDMPPDRREQAKATVEAARARV